MTEKPFFVRASMIRRQTLAVHMLVAVVASSLVAAEETPCTAAASLDSTSVHQKATHDLIQLLTDECIDELRRNDGEFDRLSAVERELSQRRPTTELLEAFESATGMWSSFVIVGLLRNINDPEVGRHLKVIAGKDTGLQAYLALKYFAERGDEWALKRLNDNYFAYPVSSAEWATIAELFGRNKFRPAARNLARSVDAASLNLGGAAHESLCKLFPEAADAANLLTSPEAAATYWTDYVDKHQTTRTP